ncbi:MAG TPA: BON domain-containing protein [Lacipirellula sp.]
MQVRSFTSIAFTAAVIASALLVGEVVAQSSRGMGSSRQSLRQGFQSSGGGSQRLPFSAMGRGGQNAGFGNRGTMGAGMGMGAGLGAQGGALGQGGVGDGPLSAGLAQTAGERFQENGFVGRDAEDVRAGFDSLSGGRGPGGMMDMMIENLNEMRESRRRWREQNAAPAPVRVRLEPAFDVPTVPAVYEKFNVETRLGRAIGRAGIGSVRVTLNGRTAVISGVATSEHDRALAAQLAALEPGVSQVENRVTILAPPAAPPQ